MLGRSVWRRCCVAAVVGRRRCRGVIVLGVLGRRTDGVEVAVVEQRLIDAVRENIVIGDGRMWRQ